MNPFLSIEGTVSSLTPMRSGAGVQSGCTLMISVNTRDQGEVNLVVTSQTYVLDQAALQRGDTITAFYDSTAPAPLIFPPQYRAVAMARTGSGTRAAFDYFDRQLVSSDGALRLNPGAATSVSLPNGQRFFGAVAGHYLFVVYSAATRSIPAITTPSRIVVFCSQNS